MFLSKAVRSSATKPMIQLQYKGLGPDRIPLKQDWSKRWCTLPEAYTEEFARRIDEFETRDGDVFVVTYMKSGTTWMQELAWLLLNDLDFDKANASHTMRRIPYLESSILISTPVDNIIVCNEMQDSSRLIKSHLPPQLLPRQLWEHKRKIIYVARNPKDVVISCYHFVIGMGYWQGTLDEFVDQFVTDRIVLTSYWSHIIDFYRMRHEPNVFFVTYEEMKRDLKDVMERLSRFLDCRPLSESEKEMLLEHLSFGKMKENQFTNPTTLIQKVYKAKDDFEFMRRGIIGSYKDELSPEQINKLDKWTQDNLKEYGMKESDIFGNI